MPAVEPFPSPGFQIAIEKGLTDDLPRFELEQTRFQTHHPAGAKASENPAGERLLENLRVIRS